jgi:hypothetical protein
MLRQTIIFAGLLIASCLSWAGEAGRVVFVTGNVNIAGRAIALGDAVQEGDELNTGADGYVYLKTVDEGFFILRPNGRARIVRYHIDSQNPANTRVKLELLTGVARTISGKGVKQARENFRFNTPVAAIGVRGTDFTVFTDQETSRIAVISGGVVVSGFSGTCGPEGSGPCEGSNSRELFANQGEQLLQIKRGQGIPQLMRSGSLAPDMSAPPRSDEPTAPKGASNSAAAPGAMDYSLDPEKANFLQAAGSQVSQPPTPGPVSTPDPAVPPVVVVPKPPEVLWGRWQAVASLPADSVALAKLKAGGYDLPAIVGSFFISRVGNTALVMPADGHASFGLVNSEAYIKNGNQAPVAATIQDSRLDVDFASRAFSTSLTVVAPGARVNISAQGDVTQRGELVSNILLSNSTVRGYLGGANATEAGYIFNSLGSSTVNAFGATSWSR